MEDDYDDTYGDCWECGGEGYVYNCMTEYACINAEDGCERCMRRCHVCNQAKPNPDLQQALSDALSKST